MSLWIGNADRTSQTGTIHTIARDTSRFPLTKGLHPLRTLSSADHRHPVLNTGPGPIDFESDMNAVDVMGIDTSREDPCSASAQDQLSEALPTRIYPSSQGEDLCVRGVHAAVPE
ncbi:hypothetical protein NUW54_g14566 [Trametes sanguinea]|uniref:Uncharacterized protein n=1 Tax=Trametes sanguinea TaxID=158606 RepID=A0ACC1MCG2_9APHY|nr:hypothetical protein NUW54_g14566 [Trametes sanguinea]